MKNVIFGAITNYNYICLALFAFLLSEGKISESGVNFFCWGSWLAVFWGLYFIFVNDDSFNDENPFLYSSVLSYLSFSLFLAGLWWSGAAWFILLAGKAIRDYRYCRA